MTKYMIKEHRNSFGRCIFHAYRLIFFGLIKIIVADASALTRTECHEKLLDRAKDRNRKLYKEILEL